MQVIAWQLRFRGQTIHSTQFIYVLPGWWGRGRGVFGQHASVSALRIHIDEGRVVYGGEGGGHINIIIIIITHL